MARFELFGTVCFERYSTVNTKYYIYYSGIKEIVGFLDLGRGDDILTLHLKKLNSAQAAEITECAFRLLVQKSLT